MPTYLLTNDILVTWDTIWHICSLVETNPNPSSDYTTILRTRKAAPCAHFEVYPFYINPAYDLYRPTECMRRGWRTETTLNGSFAAGNWTFKIKLHAGTKYGGQVVECWVRVWKSSNGDMTGATALTDWLEFPGDLTIPDKAPCSTVADTLVSSLPELTLTNEYLYVEYVIHIHTAGDSANCELGFVCDESAGEEVTTTTFTEVAVGWKPLEYFSEPPTGGQWNRLRYESEPPVSGAWNKLKYAT